MDSLKLITLNVNGLRAPAKRRALFADLRKSKADIIFLQETHCTTNEERIWLSEWGATGYFSQGRSNARGVCTLFSRSFTPKLLHKITDADGRLLLLQIKSDERVFTLVNLYDPPRARLETKISLSTRSKKL